MQVTETLSQGLKREFKVVLPATELEQRLTSELTTLKDRVRINGFRPGKVPVAHLRRVYGRSVMADVVQNAVNEANRKIVEENSLKLAYEPQVQFPESKDEVEKAMEAKADLAFTVALEVLPTFELADLSDVTVKKPVAEVTDAEINESLERMAKQNVSYATKDGRGRDRRPRHGRLRRTHRRQGVRGRQGRGHQGRDRLEHLHPGLRGPARRPEGGRRQARQDRRSRPITWPSISPARTPSSTSRSRKSRRRASSRSTTSSPRASAWSPSTS